MIARKRSLVGILLVALTALLVVVILHRRDAATESTAITPTGVAKVEPAVAPASGPPAPVPMATSAHSRTVTATPDARPFASANQPVPGSSLANGLDYAAGPSNGVALVQAALKNPAIMRPITGVPDNNGAQISPPIPLYTLDAQAVTAGGGLEALRATGSYYYLVESGGQFITIGVVGQDGSGGALLTNFGMAGLAQTVGTALQQLSGLARVQSSSYEPRIVQVHGLMGSGTIPLIWLKSRTDASDLIWLPTLRAFGTLEPNTLYSAEDFFRQLQVFLQNRGQ